MQGRVDAWSEVPLASPAPPGWVGRFRKSSDPKSRLAGSIWLARSISKVYRPQIEAGRADIGGQKASWRPLGPSEKRVVKKQNTQSEKPTSANLNNTSQLICEVASRGLKVGGGGFLHFYFSAETESRKPKGRMQAAEKTSKGRRKAASKIIARISISATPLSPYGHFRGGQGPRNQAWQVIIAK